MNVLIVEGNGELGRLWQRHIARLGAAVTLVASAAEAVDHLRFHDPAVIVLNLGLEGALGVADYAHWRRPGAKVVCVTGATFFSDGSIFRYSPNAAACLGTGVAPEDLATVVAWHGRAA